MDTMPGPAQLRPTVGELREQAIDAAMAVFDRSLKLMSPPRHVVEEAIDAAGKVWADDEQAQVDGLVAEAQFAGMEIAPDGDVRFRFKQAHDVLIGVCAAFDELCRSAPNYVEQDTTFTHPTDIPQRRYHVIVVKPDGKSPHQLRQDAERRATAAEDALAAMATELDQAKAEVAFLRAQVEHGDRP